MSGLTLSYDPASQVTQVLHQLTATNTQINQAAYAYNPVGNRTSLADRRGNQAFGYDNLDRLTSASHPLLATPQAFAYDPAGNRTTGGSIVNVGNQLTADENHSVPSACPVEDFHSTHRSISSSMSRLPLADLNYFIFDSQFPLPSDLFLCLITSCSSIDDRPRRTTS